MSEFPRRRALRPDAQAFDEIRIVTVPRYKTSGLSGNEWRISAAIEFWRKGRLLHTGGGLRDVETACAYLYAELHRAIEEGAAMFAGEGDFCDQEGCADTATVTYRIKEEFSRDRPHEWHGPPSQETVRRFCARHSRRGDCGFDDSDANYELVEGDVADPPAGDVRKAASITVALNSIDELPAAIADIRAGMTDGKGY